MSQIITVREFNEKGAPEGFKAFLPTLSGDLEVGYIRWPEVDPWAVCPKENGGYGMSFMVGLNTHLILKEVEE